MGPVLYVLYRCDIPVLKHDTITTFTDNTAVLAVENTSEEAINKLQETVNKIHLKFFALYGSSPILIVGFCSFLYKSTVSRIRNV